MIANLLIACMCMASIEPAELKTFPACVQFSPLPSGKGWKGEPSPLSEEIIKDTIDNILEHGFNGIESPTHLSAAEEKMILDYAQSRGMFVTRHLPAMEAFGRDAPPEVCVYSAEYPAMVRQSVMSHFPGLGGVPRLFNVFPFQDEPFHGGEKSFGLNQKVKDEFKKRYGYELPESFAKASEDPKTKLDFLNFRSDYFPDGWRQAYRIMKEVSPEVMITLTHDSHNTFGGGCGSHTEMAIDDVFHWGGDFADMFVFDIYPYNSVDFRFGEPSTLRNPRMSQTHYSLSQMRNLTEHNKKRLGFWVETHHPAWFTGFLDETLRQKYWTESEMAITAVAHGADYLLTGLKIPIDAGHWDAFGRGLQLLGKTGNSLAEMPRAKARAAMIFPRSQMLQIQEEYFDVALSFELFMRGYGELDILHEEQVVDDTLNGYDIVVLFDVQLLPLKVMERLAAFVEAGGTIIADCVPTKDELCRESSLMTSLFGVKNPASGRIPRVGHWVNYKNTNPAMWHFRTPDAPDEASMEIKRQVRGEALGRKIDMPIVSPRACQADGAEVLLTDSEGAPALLTRKHGKGRVWQLGFCVLDTYWASVRDGKKETGSQIASLFHEMALADGLRANAWCDNPEIEAAVRLNAIRGEGYLFLINHEAESSKANVELSIAGLQPASIVDIGADQPVEFTSGDEGVLRFSADVPVGEFKIYSLKAK